MNSTVMIAATGSGKGKTTFVSGLLNVLKDRDVHAFKCGPDYIDPMFHKEVLKIPSTNLDLHFCDEDILNYVFDENKGQTNIIEAAMGLYDGIGTTSKASAYEIAKTLSCAIVLVIDGYGMGYSIIPLIEGFLGRDNEGLIKGVVINRITEKYYNKIAPVIESETGLKVFGYLPKVSGGELKSRYLGLMMPTENSFDEKLSIISSQIRKTVDIDGIVSAGVDTGKGLNRDSKNLIITERLKEIKLNKKVQVAIAKDEAFTFYYEENIKYLNNIGAKITYFSPLNDKSVPEDADVLIFYGGYPENFAKKLSENKQMIKSIRDAYQGNVKIIAECGGFMYLLNGIEVDGNVYEMVGIIDGDAYREKGLVRFGYANVENDKYCIKAHEFHHYDVTKQDYSENFIVRNEASGEEYKGMICNERMIAGFPHLYYLSCPDFIVDFLGDNNG